MFCAKGAVRKCSSIARPPARNSSNASGPMAIISAQADRPPHRIAPADPILEPENPRGINAIGGGLVTGGDDGGELRGRVGHLRRHPALGGVGVGHRLDRGEGLGGDDHQRGVRVQALAACRGYARHRRSRRNAPAARRGTGASASVAIAGPRSDPPMPMFTTSVILPPCPLNAPDRTSGQRRPPAADARAPRASRPCHRPDHRVLARPAARRAGRRGLRSVVDLLAAQTSPRAFRPRPTPSASATSSRAGGCVDVGLGIVEQHPVGRDREIAGARLSSNRSRIWRSLFTCVKALAASAHLSMLYSAQCTVALSRTARTGASIGGRVWRAFKRRALFRPGDQDMDVDRPASAPARSG